MKANLKSQIHDELAKGPGSWLTIDQLVALIPSAKGRDATVARALRKLREEGCVAAQPVPGNRRYRQWTYTRPSTTPSLGPPRTAARAASQASNAPKAPKRSIVMSTFQTAVETVINEFVAAQKTFSAFDITKEVRDRSNAGTVTIDKAETGSVHVSGNDVPRIEHDQVKVAVVDLFGQGKMTGYDRSNNGQFWQYGPAAAAPVDPSASGNGSGSPPPVDGNSYDGSSSL